ncbi:MAG: hotdog domain-containing protein [Bacillota bacterium]
MSRSPVFGTGNGLPTSLIRLRVSQQDVHYGGGVVAGAKMMGFFGDVATELSILYDGDEGLMAAYDLIEFKQPVHAGDFLEIRGRITEVGRRSRKVEMEAYKVIEGDWEHGSSKASLLAEPILVARAHGTVVAPKSK